jgi:hypothetical protein
MEKKSYNTFKSNSSKRDSNPFPKLKPTGSLVIKQTQNKTKTGEIASQPSQSFLSKLKIFEPNQNKFFNNIRHSKTMEINEKDIPIEKEEIKKDESLKEKQIIQNRNSFGEKDNQKKDEDIIEKEDKQVSSKTEFDENKRKSFLLGFTDNLKKINKTLKDGTKILENQKNKIINFINQKRHNDIKFEKPKNFEEIEKQWNYAKILLDNNILDCTSK